MAIRGRRMGEAGTDGGRMDDDAIRALPRARLEAIAAGREADVETVRVAAERLDEMGRERAEATPSAATDADWDLYHHRQGLARQITAEARRDTGA